MPGICWAQSSLVEVGPCPHAERRAATGQGKFSHPSRVLTVALGQDDLTFFLLDCERCFLLGQNIASEIASVLVF